MATCQRCNKEMLGAKSCDPAPLNLQGKTYIRKRYGEEAYQPENPPSRCRDCGTPEGGFHHLYCCVESCPVCGGQFITCEHG